MGLAIAPIITAASTPAVAAEDFDWHLRPYQQVITGSLANLSEQCAFNFGFTRVPSPPAGVAERRLYAFLLLQPDAEAVLEEWAGSMIILRETPDDAAIERAADALLAADADPSRRQQAEELYVTTVTAHVRWLLSHCVTFRAHPFIGENYLQGDGTLPADLEAQARQAFQQGLSAPSPAEQDQQHN